MSISRIFDVVAFKIPSIPSSKCFKMIKGLIPFEFFLFHSKAKPSCMRNLRPKLLLTWWEFVSVALKRHSNRADSRSDRISSSRCLCCCQWVFLAHTSLCSASTWLKEATKWLEQQILSFLTIYFEMKSSKFHRNCLRCNSTTFSQ